MPVGLVCSLVKKKLVAYQTRPQGGIDHRSWSGLWVGLLI